MVLRFNIVESRWDAYYNIAEYDSQWEETIDWCWQFFGHPGVIIGAGVWDYDQRAHTGVIHVFTERDAMLFNLRWA